MTLKRISQDFISFSLLLGLYVSVCEGFHASTFVHRSRAGFKSIPASRIGTRITIPRQPCARSMTVHGIHCSASGTQDQNPQNDARAAGRRDKYGVLLSSPLHARKISKTMVLGLCVLVGMAPWPASAAVSSITAVADPRRVIALLLTSSAIGMWSEDNTRIGSVISGAMVTFFCAMFFTAFGMLPAASDHPIYNAVWEHLVPMAIVQMMLSLDREQVKRALSQSGGMLLAFAIASIGTFSGCLAACALVRMKQAWQLAAVFASTYIGGTLNMIATAEAIGLRDTSVLAACFSSDMLMMALYFGGLFYLG
jgi:hypothetical protein